MAGTPASTGSFPRAAACPGPFDALAITGQLDVEEIHRWDRMPLWGHSWRVSLQGALDLVNQTLSIESVGRGQDPAPLSVRLDVERYLTQPDWRLGFVWSGFPLDPLAPIARHLGLPLPEDARLSGSVDGSVTVSRRDMLEGAVQLRDAAMVLAGGPPVRFARADLLLQRDTVTLPPAQVEIPDQGSVQVQGSYSSLSGLLTASIRTAGLPSAAFRLQAFGIPEPLPDAMREGRWSGELRYRQERNTTGAWSGQAVITHAAFPVPGLAAPVQLSRGVLTVNGPGWRLTDVRASAGGVEFGGDYDAAASTFRLRLGETDLAQLEALFEPSLLRPGGFLARTLRLGRPAAPRWLAARRLSGGIQAEALVLGPARFTGVSGRLRWDGTRIELSQLRARIEGGSVLANGAIDLAGSEPSYAINVLGERIAWRNGRLTIDGDFAASGAGSNLLATLGSEGMFELAGAPAGFDSLAGCYRLDLTRTPSLRLSELRAAAGSEIYLGTGALRDDGTLLVELESGARQLRVIGTLAGLRVEHPPGWSADPD
ncbi:MAG: hypothetical protein IPM24_14700 [Bryobacterales bacterium]|nr:hypothetical protein [Bryobacterales bacterium]